MVKSLAVTDKVDIFVAETNHTPVYHLKTKENMKRIFSILIMMLCLAPMSFAQDLRNSSNSYIGKIESDGTVRNSSNSYVGKICSDGTIRNSSNSYVGKLESNGTVRNSSNSYAGKIESDGTVRNSSNSYMGKVESDGTVRNSSNSYIGSAKGVKKEYAALFFFFNFFK